MLRASFNMLHALILTLKYNAGLSKTFKYIISLLGREEGYTVKYTPLYEGVPEGTPEGKGVYWTVYPESSSNTDSISF